MPVFDRLVECVVVVARPDPATVCSNLLLYVCYELSTWHFHWTKKNGCCGLGRSSRVRRLKIFVNFIIYMQIHIGIGSFLYLWLLMMILFIWESWKSMERYKPLRLGCVFRQNTRMATMRKKTDTTATTYETFKNKCYGI